MIEKTCRCGKSKKNFKIDIGPFFIAQCCTDAGYDHHGRKIEGEKPAQPETPSQSQEIKPEEPKKSGPTKSEMKKMKVDELKAIAKERGVEGAEDMSKRKLLAALLD